MKNKNFHHLWY